MTMLRLSPDSERLRRIAKAHAAGELSTPDYRRIRTEVIDGYGGHTLPDRGGDDTQPRAFDRSITPPVQTDWQPEPTAPPARISRTATWSLALLVALIAMALVLTAAWADTTPLATPDPDKASAWTSPMTWNTTR